MKSKVFAFALLLLPFCASAQNKAATDSLMNLMALEMRLNTLYLGQILALADSLPTDRAIHLVGLTQHAFPMLKVESLADLKAIRQYDFRTQDAIDKINAPIQAFYKLKGMQLYINSYFDIYRGKY